MNDTTLTDMTPFLENQRRRTQRVFMAMLCLSLVVSAVIYMYGFGGGSAIANRGALWFPILVYPLFISAFWSALTIWEHKRPKPPGGRYLLNADDARNVARVARAGFVFVTGFLVVQVVAQAGMALAKFGALQSWDLNGQWGTRAILFATGALSIYMGNVWPRMPTPRAPDQKPVTRMKYNRLGGWLNVLAGLMLVLASLMPVSLLVPAVFVGSLAVGGVVVAFAVSYHSAMKSPDAT